MVKHGLVPTQEQLTMGVVVAGSAFGLSYVTNRFGAQLSAIPGFKFISGVEKDGLLESSLGLFIIMYVAKMVGAMFMRN